jgi:hypothetical protein
MHIVFSHYDYNFMTGENFVPHLEGLGGTPVCRGSAVAHHFHRHSDRSIAPYRRATACKFTRRYYLEDLHRHLHHRKNLKSGTATV